MIGTPTRPTADLIRELLSYDPLTGIFTRLVRGKGVRVGDVAGGDCRGYIRIRVLGRMHFAHRLAWVHFHGMWPVGQIDHIDGCRDHNAIANLRDVSPSVNLQNQHRAHSNNTHGCMGAMRNGKRWQAQIRVDGKRVYLGQFDTPELAHIAYIAAKRELHVGCKLGMGRS
jgi:hypothetical protein